MLSFFNKKKKSTESDNPIAPSAVEEQQDIPQKSWLKRLSDGLKKSSNKLTGGIHSIFTRKKLDDSMLEELEELLITTDIGIQTVTEIIQDIAKQRMDKDITPLEVQQIIADKITTILSPTTAPLNPSEKHQPHIIKVCGVNGNGKTTTIGKLAAQYKQSGKKVMLVACDTFRAAAVEQLQVWAERSGAVFFQGEPNADPASVAYAAIEQAKRQAIDIIMLDTAGRLHNKANLMQELEKITKVVQKLDADAPHDTVLVLDATTGQNAHNQIQSFSESVNLTGLIVTKLDGTAKGGVVVSLAKAYPHLKFHALGVGESIDDLQPFEAKLFANSLLGVDQQGITS